MSSNEMKMWVTIERPVHEVWTALVTSKGVEAWLAEAATIEAREGGRYRLRSGAPLCSGAHVVRHVDEDKRLELDWELVDERSTVIVALTTIDTGTRVDVTHQHSGNPALHVDKACPDVSSMLMELWAYVCGSLKTYLELGEAKPRFDPERKPSPEIRLVMTIAAPPQDVFDMIDDPDKIKSWNHFGSEPASNDRRVGGNYSFGWESEKKHADGPHEITEYEAGRRITYRWYGTPPTLVSWTVEPLPGSANATRLTLTHSGFEVDRNMLVGWNCGWAGFLHQIALRLERGTEPTWMGC